MIYAVHVKPNSKKGPLVIADGDRLTVYLRAKPVDGAANTALIKLLAEYFDVHRSQISIKTGQTSRHKLIELGI